MLLVIGTTNLAKGRELTELLAPHGFLVKTLQEFSTSIEVVEDGATFADNARRKASQQAKHLGRWVLADDSGLEVHALQGAPGIYSARYAGQDASDADNNAKLLAELEAIPGNKRGARYYCHVSVADPSGTVRAESSGVCGGRIRSEGSGSNGFGYDPLFEVVEYHATFGQLGLHVKRALSHRGRAMRAVVPKLVCIASQGEWDD
ncbi:MAG: RdgB/HAM1 family non-canonical purine NTP pyrophosphatase [Pirellulales bacterium]|nr:RdgB/HAM1 family non-canonical purine NTP pyrophosphatase [Pirellulales bacterium]